MIKYTWRPDSVRRRSDLWSGAKLTSSNKMRCKANLCATIKRVSPQKSCSRIFFFMTKGWNLFFWYFSATCLNVLLFQIMTSYISPKLLISVRKLNSANNSDCIFTARQLFFSSRGKSTVAVFISNAMRPCCSLIYWLSLFFHCGFLPVSLFFKEASLPLIHLHQNLTFRLLMCGRDDYIPAIKMSF